MCSVMKLPEDNIERQANINADFSGVISRKHRFFHQRILSKSFLKKKLCAYIVLGSVSFAVTFFLLIINFGRKYDSKICVEYDCILSATRILEGMNTSADPCDDFYEYVCGNWPTHHAVNPDDEINSWFLERGKIVNNKIKSLLEAPYDNKDTEPIQRMKQFYSLCMDTVSLNRKGLTPIFQILDKLGLPRILPTANTAIDLNLGVVLSRVQRLLNFDILIQLSIRFNTTTGINMLSVGPATNDVSLLLRGKTLTWNRYTFEISPEEYLLHQVSLMTAVIAEVNAGALHADDIMREAIKIVFLEAQLKLDLEEAFNEEELYMTLNELQECMFANISPEASISTFSWRDYLTALMQNLNVSINMSSIVHVSKPSYFQMLGRHLVHMNPINFQRFVWWKVVHAVSMHTTDVMRMHEYIFNQNILRGIAQVPTRTATCTELTKSSFSEALAFALSAHQNIAPTINQVNKMMSNIKTVFREIITNSEWIDENTKNISIQKLDSIRTYVGYPQNSLDLQRIVERSKKVTIFRNDFMKTLVTMRASLAEEVLMRIHTPKKQYDNYENDSWSVDPTEVNAFYSREINSIAVPSGILQYPFYVNGIQAVNYGAIGSILGHELTHGFDNEGKNYDWNGDKKVTWSELMISRYNNRSECFIDQYSKYIVSNNLTIDGRLTLAENIADNGGIKEAFYSYEKYERENGVEKSLPGLENFSPKQLLFMSFANVWCKKQNDVSLRFSLLDEHSPNKYRVIGSLSNLEEFSRTWKCDKKAKMNPDKKCVLW